MSSRLKIWHWGRDGRICRVVYQLNGSPMQERVFPAAMSDEAIRAALSGETVPANAEPPPKNPRLTRKEMIAALAAAGIRDYDQSRFPCVKAAYEEALANGKIKLG